MKKILIIFHDDCLDSGATMSMMKIVSYLSHQQNINVDCIIPDRGGKLENFLLGLNVTIYKFLYYNQVFSRDGNIFKRFINIFKGIYKMYYTFFVSFHKIEKKLNLSDYNIIYTNTSTVYLGGWIAKKYSINHIWHIREYTEIDQNNRRFLGKKYFSALIKKSHSDLIFISKDLRNYYSWCLEYANSVSVIYNSLNERCIGDFYKKKNDKINIIVTGTFRKEKGQFMAIKAVEQLNREFKNIDLYLFGKENTFSVKLKRYCDNHNLVNIYFPGYVDNMKPIWKKMDIAIVASKREAFGRIIIEYFVNGITVIGSDSGAIPELVEDGQTGYLFETDNLDSLINCIKKVINSNNQVELINKKAYNYGLNFCKDITNEKVLDLINSLLLQN